MNTLHDTEINVKDPKQFGMFGSHVCFTTLLVPSGLKNKGDGRMQRFHMLWLGLVDNKKNLISLLLSDLIVAHKISLRLLSSNSNGQSMHHNSQNGPRHARKHNSSHFVLTVVKCFQVEFSFKVFHAKPRLSGLCHLCPLMSRACHSDFCLLDMI